MRTRPLAVAIAVAATSLGGGVATGAEPPSADTAGPPRVEIAIVGEVANADALAARIVSWFRPLHVPVQTTKLAHLDRNAVLAPPPNPGVHAWIAVPSDETARVFFTVATKDAEAPHYLVTDLSLAHGLDDLASEQLAQVVYFSSMGLWAGNLESTRKQMEEGLPPRPAAAPAQAPEPEATTPSAKEATDAPSSGVRVRVEYSARWRNAPGLAQTVGAALGAFRRRGAYEIGGLFHAGVLLPQKAMASGVELDTQGVAFALGATGARDLASHTRLEVEVGFSVDAVRYRTGALADASLTPTSGGTDLQPFAVARVGLEYEAGPVGLGLHALVATELFRTHYDVAIDARRSEVLFPWIVQPGIVAGASW
jgi:hypothetical protein